ncbi:MAG: phage integrase SAM-like domain-containing protein [Paludibacteraceae bacterium]|nr:phage integrase SAM-like domain-containing protein [Paludibacteraceae bacterium]
MARLKLDIDTRCLKNGAAQIRLRINHKGTSAYYGTGVYVEPRYFIGSSLYDPVSRKAPTAAVVRERVGQMVGMVDEFLNDTDRSVLDRMTATDIREAALGVKRRSGTDGVHGAGRLSWTEGVQCAGRLSEMDGMLCTDLAAVARSVGSELQTTNGAKRNAQTGDIAGSRGKTDFVAFFEDYGESRRTIKTQDSYAYAAKVLREYCEARRMVSLTFMDIDYSRLVDFARWLESTGRSHATRHMLESYVRAAYRDAQKRRLVSRELDPYYDYSIKPVPLKDIETLSAKEMHALMVCEPKLGGQRMGRDIALMSFYLCGANLIDLYEMQDGQECVFVRHKIEHRYQRELHIRIEPELAALVERYKGDGMLLSFKAKYKNYESFRHKIAHRLRELSGELGFSVTMPKIRRTWATIAGELECPDSVINKSMGHVDATVNDRSYKDYKWSQTADWNRKIIDYIKQQ